MTATIDAAERTGVRNDRRYVEELDKRVLIYDGAMGTQIHEAGLTAEDYGGVALEGCNENLVLIRPEVIERDPRGLPRSRGRRDRDRHLPGESAEAGRVGTGRQDARRSTAKRPRSPARAADRWSTPERPRFVAGSIGPTGMLPSADDPALSKITYAELSRYLLRAGAGARRGRRRSLHRRDDGRYPRTARGDHRDQPPQPRARSADPDPGAGVLRRQRADAPRHRYRGGDDDPRSVARGRSDRAQLRHRAGAYARADPLPHRA